VGGEGWRGEERVDGDDFLGLREGSKEEEVEEVEEEV
jgi:hypothetical protein